MILCKEVVNLKKLNKKLYNKFIVVDNEKINLYEALKFSKVEISRLRAQKNA